MADNWLEIPGENVNVQDIMRQIRRHIAAREGEKAGSVEEEPTSIAASLWGEMIGGQSSPGVFPLSQQECDIVPRGYAIEWRVPLLGPIHAVVRRIINAEIRRYLLPALEKQSTFNRKVRQILKDLIRENALLRQEVKELRQKLEQDHRK
ncbi:MAG: hypothetical protein QHJ74_10215 [Anaerolineae bacterium]|nr:hypothetical protein [Anaerolineae bacterium]